ncbi:MAG: NAD(P)-dependent oxidoreductase [Pararhodobacter sp.]|nr:NAD(P)-dependent oxidoreductase [Pararhodobacter sp.]
MTIAQPINPLALIGFGEAARAFVAGFGNNRPAQLQSFDRKTTMAATRAGIEAAFGAHGVTGAPGPAEALAGAQLALCLVTADQALAAASAAAPHLPRGCWWFDGNSCAPQTKQQAAEIITRAGGRYVDMAIMAPVHPGGIEVPICLSGPDADTAAAVLRSLGFSPQPVGAQVGAASAIKMIRSVMIKGIEALSAECFLAAHRAGVEAQVLASLGASDPALNWPARGAYNLERMLLHGARRAAEMREAVRTLQGLGLPAGMSAACVDWQESLAALNLATDDRVLSTLAKRILAALDKQPAAARATPPGSN